MGKAALATLVVIAACGRLGFDPLGPNGGAGGDGAPGDPDATGGPQSCGSMFPTGAPCAGWGTSVTLSAGLKQDSGTLTVTPDLEQVATGGCTHAAVAIGAGGAYVEVVQTLNPGAQSAETMLALGAGTSSFYVATNRGNLEVDDPAGNMSVLTYDPVADHWWRIRPLTSGTSYDGSPDGVTWTQLATSTSTIPATTTVSILGATLLAEANPGSAIFGQVGVCGP